MGGTAAAELANFVGDYSDGVCTPQFSGYVAIWDSDGAIFAGQHHSVESVAVIIDHLFDSVVCVGVAVVIDKPHSPALPMGSVVAGFPSTFIIGM